MLWLFILMSYRPILFTCVLSLQLAVPSLALAQTAGETPAAADPAVVPPPPAPAQTGVAEPVDTAPATGAVPISTASASQDPHPEVVERTWPNRPLLITGTVLLVGTYGASAIVAAASDRKADDKLFIPVVGPWLDLKNRDCEVNACGDDTLNKALIIGSGALQGAGAVMMLLGLVIPESEKKPWYLIGDEKLNVAPRLGYSLTGFSATGSF